LVNDDAAPTFERKCTPGPQERWLTVLPGIGWDNLVNEERGPTIDLEKYDSCRHSIDGQFLIPDDILIEPRKHSQVDLTSDVFESTSQCTSLTAYSINSAIDFGATYYRINGDFSFEKESLRQDLVRA
uniref:Peptidase S1 domain-containing protein n=1 Tax=Echinostoma caproni TaxID=27848 RepID=A0A183AD18_9TREM